jgi:putative hydrolase of the HAD superfamily
MNSIRAIIFDLGYTLIEYRECSWPDLLDSGLRQVHEKLFNESSPPPDYESLKQQFAAVKEEHRITASRTLAGWQLGDVFRDVLSGFGLAYDDDVIIKLSELIYSPSRKYMYVDDGTLPTLNALKEAGLSLGIISNTIYPHSFHDADLENFGFGDIFDFKIYSSALAHRKPHPSIFEAGIEKAGAAADKMIYVGDCYDNDVNGARSVGMRPILKYCARQKYPDPMPDDIPIINSLSDLIHLPNLSLSRTNRMRNA